MRVDFGAKFLREDSDFNCHGTRCAGWLYRPENVVNPPLIVMAHGFAGERSFALPAFAERFAEIGVAVLLFDYRTFGDSDGLPRNNVDPENHGQDWDAAIAHGRSLPGVNTGQISLWGTSFSGAHVVCAAARDGNIASIIALVPFSGFEENAPERSVQRLFKYVLPALWDRLKTKLTGNPHYIPIIGLPGSVSALNTEECVPGYLSMVPKGSVLDNRTPAKVMLKLLDYDPGKAAELVNCPVLLIAGEYDTLISMGSVERLASILEKSELIKFPCNHFEPFGGEWFEKNVLVQTEFLRRHRAA
jgi:pimeloyl-ACP methyl ester carboxylesterase